METDAQPLPFDPIDDAHDQHIEDPAPYPPEMASVPRKRHNFAMIPDMADIQLKGANYRLYAHYKHICKEFGYCDEAERTTCEAIGMGLFTLRRARQYLANHGYVVIAEKGTPNRAGIKGHPTKVIMPDIWKVNDTFMDNFYEQLAAAKETDLNESKRTPSDEPEDAVEGETPEANESKRTRIQSNTTTRENKQIHPNAGASRMRGKFNRPADLRAAGISAETIQKHEEDALKVKGGTGESGSAFIEGNWTDLERLIIQACGTFRSGLTDSQKAALDTPVDYVWCGHEVHKSWNRIYDINEDARKFVASRIGAHQQFAKPTRKPISRSRLIHDILNVRREKTGWLAWRRLNGAEPEVLPAMMIRRDENHAADD